MERRNSDYSQKHIDPFPYRSFFILPDNEGILFSFENSDFQFRFM